MPTISKEMILILENFRGNLGWLPDLNRINSLQAISILCWYLHQVPSEQKTTFTQLMTNNDPLLQNAFHILSTTFFDEFNRGVEITPAVQQAAAVLFDNVETLIERINLALPRKDLSLLSSHYNDNKSASFNTQSYWRTPSSQISAPHPKNPLPLFNIPEEKEVLKNIWQVLEKLSNPPPLFSYEAELKLCYSIIENLNKIRSPLHQQFLPEAIKIALLENSAKKQNLPRHTPLTHADVELTNIIKNNIELLKVAVDVALAAEPAKAIFQSLSFTPF